MKIMDILSYVGTAIGFVIAFISVYSAKKKGNNIDNLKSGVKNSQNIIALIRLFIPQAIEEAEKSGAVGAIKKLIANAFIITQCAKNNINYNDYAEIIDQQIEDLIELTNNVNVNKIEVKKEV